MSDRRLYVYVLFDSRSEPIAAGAISSGTKTVYNISGHGCNTTLREAADNKELIAALINDAVANNIPVITSGFKYILSAFPVAKVRGVDYPVYDLNWSVSADRGVDGKAACSVVSAILDRLTTTKPKPWQRIFANAAVVYQAVEERGVLLNGMPHKPIWAQTTYSGRSKNLVINIQGADGQPGLTNPDGSEDDIHVYLDWVAADMRIASILSGDELLQESFIDSDPYTKLEEILTTETGTISRKDCKLQLLQAINSFNFTHPALESIFTGLGLWLQESNKRLEEQGYLESILGRKFMLSKARNNNKLAVLNGVFQGSVAHGMNLVWKRMWDAFGPKLLVEIHDSLGLTCQSEYVNTLLKDAVPIMTHPFSGILESNPFFPVKVSIGRRFREWVPIRIYRESGMERVVHVEADERAEAAAESQSEDSES